MTNGTSMAVRSLRSSASDWRRFARACASGRSLHKRLATFSRDIRPDGERASNASRARFFRAAMETGWPNLTGGGNGQVLQFDAFEVASAFESRPAAGTFYKDAAHGFGGGSEKVRSVSELR